MFLSSCVGTGSVFHQHFPRNIDQSFRSFVAQTRSDLQQTSLFRIPTSRRKAFLVQHGKVQRESGRRLGLGYEDRTFEPVSPREHRRHPSASCERLDQPAVFLERDVPGRDRGVLRRTPLLGLRGTVFGGQLRLLPGALPRLDERGGRRLRCGIRAVLLQLRHQRPRLPRGRGDHGLFPLWPGRDRMHVLRLGLLFLGRRRPRPFHHLPGDACSCCHSRCCYCSAHRASGFSPADTRHRRRNNNAADPVVNIPSFRY